MYIKNTGSPTRWDCTRYFQYLAGVRLDLAEELQDLTAPGRYELPSGSPLSLWRSGVTHFEANGDRIKIGARNDYGTRRFEFSYTGVSKVQTTMVSAYFLPEIVMQELVQLRNGVLRHTLSDMGGCFITIHAVSVGFQDSPIH
jgi:hypothetical protein